MNLRVVHQNHMRIVLRNHIIKNPGHPLHVQKRQVVLILAQIHQRKNIIRNMENGINMVENITIVIQDHLKVVPNRPLDAHQAQAQVVHQVLPAVQVVLRAHPAQVLHGLVHPVLPAVVQVVLRAHPAVHGVHHLHPLAQVVLQAHLAAHLVQVRARALRAALGVQAHPVHRLAVRPVQVHLHRPAVHQAAVQAHRQVVHPVPVQVQAAKRKSIIKIKNHRVQLCVDALIKNFISGKNYL